MDTEAPTIRLSSGFNRNRDNLMNSGRKSGSNGRGHIQNRLPKGARQVVTTSGNNGIDADALERYDREFAKKEQLPNIPEDMSADDNDDDDDDDEEEEKREEEKDDTMDVDENKNYNNDDTSDEEDDNYDPWQNENGDDNNNYTPITLKTKPSYGKNGVFNQTEMLNVFKEKVEYGNEFMFIQMPQVLPLKSHLNEDEKLALKRKNKVKTSLLRQMGEGEIGRIRIRQSGKAEFVFGNGIVMDINFTAPMDCYQQIMHLHCEMLSDGGIKGKSQFLGNVPPQNNLVCSYRAEDLIL